LALVINHYKGWRNNERKEEFLLKWSGNHGEFLWYMDNHREKKKLGLLWYVWILWNCVELIFVVVIKIDLKWNENLCIWVWWFENLIKIKNKRDVRKLS
jgi:hypothetical protein